MAPSPPPARPRSGRPPSARNSNSTSNSNNSRDGAEDSRGQGAVGARRTAAGTRRSRRRSSGGPAAGGARQQRQEEEQQEQQPHGEEQHQQEAEGRQQENGEQQRQDVGADGEDVEMREAEGNSPTSSLLQGAPAAAEQDDVAGGASSSNNSTAVAERGEGSDRTAAAREGGAGTAGAGGGEGGAADDEEGEVVIEEEEDMEMPGSVELSSNSAAATAPGPHSAAAAQFVARSPLSRRRRPPPGAGRASSGETGLAGAAGAAAAASQASVAMGGSLGGEGSQTAAASLSGVGLAGAAGIGTERERGETSCSSEYGGTPSALRRVRYARCDLGDMGREFLLQDVDMQRLPELPREVVDSEMERKFEDFFDHFRLEDYEGLFEVSEEDAATAALGQSALCCADAGGGAGGEASFYSLKLLQYMQQRGASLAAGIASTFYSAAAGGGGGAGLGRKNRDGGGMGGGSCCSLSFEVSLQHLFAYDRCLYTATVNAPQDAIAAFDAILRRKYGDLREAYGCYTAGSAAAAAGDPEELLLQQAPRLRLFGKPAALLDNLRTLDPSVDLDRLVCLRGVVVRCSEILPEMTLAAFRCQGQRRVGLGEKIPCLQEQYASVLNGEAIEPSLCRSCGCSHSFSLWVEQCAFASKQMVKLVEAPELLLPGEAPQAVAIYVYDELIDACRPGDRVEITGIYKAAPLRVNPRLRLQHAVFRTYINLVHIRRDDSSSQQQSSRISSTVASRLLAFPSSSSAAAEDGGFSAAPAAPGPAAAAASPAAAPTSQQQRAGAAAAAGNAASKAAVEEDEEELLYGLSSDLEAKIRAVSRRPDVYELLVRSFAPSLYGREEVKKGILCQMVGGSRVRSSGGFNGGSRDYEDDEAAVAAAGKTFRTGLHVLLCGDPATAKSQLLQYVHKLSPRCMYTSGRGSSAVGLTVSVSKDPETREFVLESGAVVLADGGVCCIDEFDKMEETARAVLHEVMEQQSVTVAKAGIVASLRSRTAILASANPAGSRYDRSKAVVENIKLPPSLFSRFDLIYLLLDTADSAADKKLAQRLCRSFAGKSASYPRRGSSSRAAAATEAGGDASHREEEEEEGEDEEKEHEETAPEENPPLPAAFLRVYLAYCRSRCCPRLTAAAAAHLRDEYLRMRRRDASARHPTATVRQLESLIRISEALAKLRLSSTVEASDAVEAVRLMNLATYMSLVDPLSGRIDFDQIHFGQTRQQRLLSQRVTDAIKAVLSAAGAAATGRAAGVTREYIFTQVKERMRQTGGIYEVIEPNVVFHTISRLEKEQIISRRAGGLYYLSVAPQPGEGEGEEKS